jgi:hypothetical protein
MRAIVLIPNGPLDSSLLFNNFFESIAFEHLIMLLTTSFKSSFANLHNPTKINKLGVSRAATRQVL